MIQRTNSDRTNIKKANFKKANNNNLCQRGTMPIAKGVLHSLSAIALSVMLSTHAFADSFVLQNINIVDVENLQIINNQHIVITDNQITSISSKKQRYKSDVRVIDMTDKFVMPGLVDTHVHHATVPDTSDADNITRMRLRKLLQGGVTSIRDMGGDVRALSSLKRRAEIDIIQSPDIYFSVIIGGQAFFSDPRTVESALGRTPGHVDWMRAVDENSNMDEIMLRALGTGATGIKIYAQVPAKVITLLEKSAKKYGLKVWSHAFVGPARPIELVNAGVETISHAPDMSAHVIDNFYDLRRKGEHITDEQQQASFELNRYDDLIKAMQQNDTILDSTLTVFEQNADNRGKRGALMDKWGKMFTKLAYDNNIAIATGTDSASDYYGHDVPLVQNEMGLLVNHVGMSPLEAIQSATLIGAKVIGQQASIGVVAEGKTANLLITHSDPSESIDNMTDIAHVIKNGQFVYRGSNPDLPFVDAKKAGGLLWLSGQLGNYPSTKVLASKDIKGQMTQAMKNIGYVLQQYDLTYSDIAKCTLMLDDIDDWEQANEAYITFFDSYPTRSAYGTSGLALGAKVEVECVATL